MNTIPEMMDAIVKPAAQVGLELRRVPVPKPGMGEVLIKIHRTAICGTDVHIYKWEDWAKEHCTTIPYTIGHEYVGEIAMLGEGVTGFEIGQRVSGEGHIVCGHCRNCRAGNAQWCKHTKGVGVERDGAFAEYLCIPATNVVPVNPALDENIVAFFDAFGNATHTALMFDCVGEDVLITGAGPIGIMAVAIAKYAGARNVIITDVNQYRLDLAKKMGATVAVNLKDMKLEDAMTMCGIKEGFDVGLEMSGNNAALSQLLGAMRNGGSVSLLGTHPAADGMNVNTIIFKGLRVQGIYGRRMYETWYKMGAMVEGGLDMSPVVTHVFDHKDFEKGFEAMMSGNSGKVILKWSEPTK